MLENLAARVNGDANLVRRGKHVNTSFLIAIDNADHIVRVEHGRIASVAPGPFITPKEFVSDPRRIAITPAATTPVPARNARLDVPAAIGNMTNVP